MHRGDGSVQNAITFVGLDVHKDSIVVSLAEAGLRGGLREVREYGKIVTAQGIGPLIGA